MLDLIREIGQTLRNNRLRTALTGLAVAWGIFMLIVLLGAARGVTNSFMENVSPDTNNFISIWRGYTSKPWKGYKDGRNIIIQSSDGDAIKADNDKVLDVTARAWASTTISAPTGTMSDFNAVYPTALNSDDLEMVCGRFINQLDIDHARRVMIIHKNDAERLFGSADKALGQTLKAMDLAWTIVGIYDHPWRSDNYAAYSAYNAVTGNLDRPYQMNVSFKDLNTREDAKEAETLLRSSLARVHEFDPEDKSAVYTWNAFETYISNMTAFSMLTIAVWVIGIFTLLSGIVGVSNIMFVSVRERTHEIGIRRAIGAKPRSILTQILSESIAVTALFGYIGIVLGMIVLQILDHFLGDSNGFSNPTVDISIAVQVTIALIIAGGIAGLFPAMKAIKIKPVEALRDE